MSSPYTVEHWIKKGFSEEDARVEIQKRRPSNIIYWINKGFSESEAKQRVKEHQSLRVLHHKKVKIEDPKKYYESHNTRIEYWLKQGYTEEEAKQKLSERQSTFSKKRCIKKYGEENGLYVWQDRQTRWQNTLKSKTIEEQEKINKKKKCCSFVYQKIW